MSHSSDQLREVLSVWKETAEGSETLSFKNRIYELLQCFADTLEPKILVNLKFVLGKFNTVPLNNEEPLVSSSEK
jgi:hypothetical protein